MRLKFLKIYSSGLQLLGPENEAIIKIRIIIILTTILWSCFCIEHLEAPPLSIAFFHGETSSSYIEDMTENKYKSVHMIATLLTLVVNVTLKIYMIIAKKKMATPTQVFVTFGDNSESVLNQEEKVSFSVSSVIGMPAIVLFTIITSLPNRRDRLLFYCPMQISAMSTVLPLIIICNNSKIKQRAENLFHDYNDKITFWCKTYFKQKSCKVCPAKNGNAIGAKTLGGAGEESSFSEA